MENGEGSREKRRTLSVVQAVKPKVRFPIAGPVS